MEAACKASKGQMSINYRARFLLLSIVLLLAAACSRVAPEGSPAAETSTPRTGQLSVVTPRIANCQDDLPQDLTFGVARWPETDFCRHSVPLHEIRGLLGRDKIPALDKPGLESQEQADLWLTDLEPVLVFEHNSDPRAYPISILIWHEIVNDVVGGLPVAITYCPLCNAGLVFSRTFDGEILDFGTTGNIRDADLVMYDRQTESWWQQYGGEAIVGELTGSRLELMPSSLSSYADFKDQYPTGGVLSIDTGFDRLYGENPYINYDSLTNWGTKFFDGEADKRLPPKMRVVGVDLGTLQIAYPFNELEAVGVINDRQDNVPLAVFWKVDTLSPLFNQYIFDSREVGSAAAYDRRLGERELTFEALDDGRFIDIQTGTTWNLFGTAVDGPLLGEQLDALPAQEIFWFAWAAFEPETLLYTTVE